MNLADMDALIEKARAEAADLPAVEHELKIAGTVITLRVHPMQPYEWRNYVATHPPRENAPMDVAWGYNFDSAARAYPKMSIVDGDEVTDLPVEKWIALYDATHPNELRNIAVLVWSTHEQDLEADLAELGKAVRAAAKKQRSRSNSASPSAN